MRPRSERVDSFRRVNAGSDASTRPRDSMTSTVLQMDCSGVRSSWLTMPTKRAASRDMASARVRSAWASSARCSAYRRMARSRRAASTHSVPSTPTSASIGAMSEQAISSRLDSCGRYCSRPAANQARQADDSTTRPISHGVAGGREAMACGRSAAAGGGGGAASAVTMAGLVDRGGSGSRIDSDAAKVRQRSYGWGRACGGGRNLGVSLETPPVAGRPEMRHSARHGLDERVSVPRAHAA